MSDWNDAILSVPLSATEMLSITGFCLICCRLLEWAHIATEMLTIFYFR